MSIWVTSSLQKFQDKIKEGKPNVQGNFTFRRSANGTETPLSEDEMKDKDRRLRAAINAFTDSTGKPTKIGQQILDTPLHAGSVIITEGTDQVNNVINQMAGENATEAEREIIIAGALAKGLFRINKDGVLQVVAGKVAALDSVKQVGAQSLDMLERINAVNYGLQGVQEVVLGAARVYGAVASIATAPVTTLVGASAGMVSRAFYEEQYNNRQATLGQLAQSAELGSAVANVGVAAVNLARVAARAVSIGDDIIQLGIAGGPKPNIPTAATNAGAASAVGLANTGDDLARGISASSPNGRPALIYRGYGDLLPKQQKVLDQLPEFGSTTIVPKRTFGQNDLAALTAKTGDEFAMFTTGGKRLIMRGDFEKVPIYEEEGRRLAAKGWRWSSHTHPGEVESINMSSEGDRAVLKAMEGKRSLILNSVGDRRLFNPKGDLLTGWLPK